MFDNQASHIIQLPSKVPETSEPANIKYLLKYLCNELMTDTRKELFALDDAMYEFLFLTSFPSIFDHDSSPHTGPPLLIPQSQLTLPH